MADMEALQKLKVPELKKLLKEKGLSVGGNKAELIGRLQGKAGSDYDQLDSSHDEDLLEEEFDSSDLTDANDSLSPMTKVATQPAKPVEIKPAAVAATKPVIKKIEVTAIKAPPSSAAVAADKLNDRLKRFGAVAEDAKKLTRANRFSADDNKSANITPVSPTTTIKKSLTPVVMSASAQIIAEQEKLKKRSERFGSQVSSDGAAKAVPSTAIIANPADVDTLKKRAQRFGELTSSSLVKVDEQERVLKRKNRFGTVLAPASNSAPDDSLSSAKKLKRAERFGISAA
jgi:SAP domain-containing ribonucleoprotein